MIYGAYGYTGRLLAIEAVRRGHRPILAGRSEERLRALAGELRLNWRAFTVDSASDVGAALRGVALVLNAAGPFGTTSRPLLDACLAIGTSYTDISGEVDVYEKIFARDAEVRSRGVSVVMGIGFDVIPTDCLAMRAARELGGADALEIAVGTTGGASAGTLRATVRMAGLGSYVRRSGTLHAHRVGDDSVVVRLPHGIRGTVSAPLGDLSSAYRSTGVRDITTYLLVPKGLRRIAPAVARFGAWLASMRPVQNVVDAIIKRFVDGPDEEALASSRTESWVRVRAAERTLEYMLAAPGGYAYTAVAGIRAVERIMRDRPVGVRTPAQALGEEFIAEIPESELWVRRDAGSWQRSPLAVDAYRRD